jgi:hypothetical protein
VQIAKFGSIKSGEWILSDVWNVSGAIVFKELPQALNSVPVPSHRQLMRVNAGEAVAIKSQGCQGFHAADGLIIFGVRLTKLCDMGPATDHISLIRVSSSGGDSRSTKVVAWSGSEAIRLTTSN